MTEQSQDWFKSGWLRARKTYPLRFKCFRRFVNALHRIKFQPATDS